MDLSNFKVKSICECDVLDQLAIPHQVSVSIWNLDEDDEIINQTFLKIREHILSQAINIDFVVRCIEKAALYRRKNIISFSKLFNLLKNEFEFDIQLDNYEIFILSTTKSPKTIQNILDIVPRNSPFYFVKYLSDNLISNLNKLISKFDTSLIELAAQYGNEEIFRFLKLNDCSYDDKICEFAIIGANFEIIEALRNEDRNFGDYISTAISCNRNNVADWIIENYDFEEIPIALCLNYMNFQAMTYCIMNGFDINRKISFRRVH